jgi:hypothetical protein
MAGGQRLTLAPDLQRFIIRGQVAAHNLRFLGNLTVAKRWGFEVVREAPTEQTTPRTDTVHLSLDKEQGA